MEKVSNEEQHNNVVLSTSEYNLFSPPFLKLKEKIYKAKQKAEAAIYASEKFINGLEIVAENQLSNDIKAHNDLVEQLNKIVAFSKVELTDNGYNIGERYSHY